MRGRCRWCLVLLSLALGACGSGECVDTDGDGRGDGCEAGPDCDDQDPTRAADCSVPGPDCTEDPFARGCPCLYGDVRPCFDGPAENAGIGQCAMGSQSCGISRFWSACEGGTLPTYEQCNGLDDDCDGVIDNGVRSPCGGCDSSCVGGVWGEAEAPFVATDVLEVTSRGELTLAQRQSAADTLWVTNTGEDTVSRIDTLAAREIARYDSGGSEPTRVAVDHHGDAWIANRAFDGQSSVTKIASSSARCSDRNNDGLVTSTGPTDVKPRGEDECVVLTVPVGGPRAVARAIAVDGYLGLDDAGGRVWVGLQEEERVVQLDDRTGAVLRSVELPGFAPFDAAFDPWGVLWLLDRDGRLARLSPTASDVEVRQYEVPRDCWQLDGMAIDADGRLTLTGFYCDQVLLFDPRTGRFQALLDLVSTRGVVADATHSYVTHTYGELSMLTRDPLRRVDTFSLADGTYDPVETTGLARDGGGQLWAVSTLGGLSDFGLATRFDPQRRRVTAQVPVGRLPYSAGDLTGWSLHSVVAPEATASHVFEGCTSGFATEWSRLHVQWLPGLGSSLRLRVRHASTRAELASAVPVDLGEVPEQSAPLTLQLADGGVVEVELTLVAGSRSGAPRVARVGLEWACGGLE